MELLKLLFVLALVWLAGCSISTVQGVRVYESHTISYGIDWSGNDPSTKTHGVGSKE